MCNFLAIGVPSTFADRVMQDLSRVFKFDECRNENLLSQCPADYRLLWMHLGVCGCGLYVPPRDRECELARFRKKYQGRGWSEAKIERAIQQKAAARSAAGLASNVVEALKDEISIVGELVLIAHWFAGEIDEEPIVPVGVRECSAADLDGVASELLEDQWLKLRVD